MTVELATVQDIDNCMESGWSDGLPVIPPYASLVEPMAEAMGWNSMTEVVGEIPDQQMVVRAEHLAATAVMAGCKREYGPLLRQICLGMLDPAFNLTGTHLTTHGPGTLIIVSGPIVEELGFEHEANALGANARVNATVGRFANMVRLFCGSGGGALQTMGTFGHPGRLSYCIAEHPDAVWGSYHVQSGLPAEASVVTIVAAEGPINVYNDFGTTGSQVLETIADTLSHLGATNFFWRLSGYIVGIGRDHMALISGEFTREEARRFLLERSVRSTNDLNRIGRIPQRIRPEDNVEFGKPRCLFASESQLTFIESGAEGGRFSTVIPRWAGNFTSLSRIVD